MKCPECGNKSPSEGELCDECYVKYPAQDDWMRHDYVEGYADDGRYDDDPNPYHGDYSEE